LRYLVWTALVAVLVAGCASTPPVPEQPPEPARQPAPVPLPEPGVSHRPEAPDAEARHCMALAMYWEARGEGREGMLAVGSVVLNRVDDHRFPGSVCGVVRQGGETPPCQFSWWCDGRSDRPTHRGQWTASLTVADELLSARPSDPTGGALFFHSTSIQSPWRRTQTARIGNHIFYH
jgi:spore germination cell wall hydrolase CwlJ-like protein